MFYCDSCAKKENYPISANNLLRSSGKCELCNKPSECNDMSGKLLNLGNVVIFTDETGEVIKPKNSCFKAKKGKYSVTGFNLKKVWGEKKLNFIPVSFIKEFSEKNKAITELLEKRTKNKEKDMVYFVFDDKGNMVKIKKDA